MAHEAFNTDGYMHGLLDHQDGSDVSENELKPAILASLDRLEQAQLSLKAKASGFSLADILSAIFNR